MSETRAEKLISYHMPDMINILFLISKRHTIDAFVSFMTFQYRGKTQTYTQYGYICIWVYFKVQVIHKGQSCVT